MLAASLTVSRIRRCFDAPISWPALRRAFGFSLPYFPAVVIAWYMNQANRFFLISFSTLASVAAFAVASKFHAIVMSAIFAFLNAWKPYAMSRAETPEAERLLVRVLSSAVIVLSLAAVLTALSARWILGVYAGQAYSVAAMSASLLVLSTSVGFGIGGYAALRLELVEKTGSISIAQFIAFAAATVLNVWLIPMFGYEGAALAVLGSSVIQAIALGAAARWNDQPLLPSWVWVPPLVVVGLLAGARLAGWL